MEQEDMGDTRNLLGLAHKLFLSCCALVLSSNLVTRPDSPSLLDNVPGHPTNLAEIRTPLDINVVYIKHHTTFQPLDKGLIANLKSITSTKPSWKW
jgi:hypothetical protein